MFNTQVYYYTLKKLCNKNGFVTNDEIVDKVIFDNLDEYELPIVSVDFNFNDHQRGEQAAEGDFEEINSEISRLLIKDLIDDLQVTKTEVAKMMNVTPRTVYNWLKGSTIPDASVFVHLDSLKESVNV